MGVCESINLSIPRYKRSKVMKSLMMIVMCGCSTCCIAQDPEGSSDRKQVIKLVLTPNLIYSSAFVFSYERVMKPWQTLSITAGYVEFPKLFGNSNHFEVQRENSKGGFMVGADYRFYMKKENRFAPPHGVYIAPFISYYNFTNQRDIRDLSSATTTTTRLVTDISFLNIGGQIGYQFVVNDRWTFDFIFFGPSISNYSLNLDLQGAYTVDQENEIV